MYKNVKKLICGAAALSLVLAGSGLGGLSAVLPNENAIVASAAVYTGSCGENVTYSLDGGVLTISGTGDMEEFVMGRCPWFTVADTITDIKIQSGVTSIGSASFYGFSALQNVTIADSVVTIGDYAFNGSEIKKITLSDNVQEIGEGAFGDCLSLKEVILGKNVLTIGDYAFAGCKNISRFSFNSENLTFIGSKAFEDTSIVSSFTKNNKMAILGGFLLDGSAVSGSVTIPSDVKQICGSAFEYNRNITSVTISSNVKFIGDHAFEGCTALSSVSFLGEINSIGMRAFSGCEALAGFSVPEGVEEISEGMFDGCKKLSQVTFSTSVSEIMDNAFNGCEALASINLTEGLVSIGDNAFGGCKKLAAINFPNTIERISGTAFESTPWFTEKLKNSPLVIVNKILVNGKTARGQIIVPDGTVAISSHAFEGNTGLNSVIIPGTVESIGDCAFLGCSRLKSVSVPASVASVGDLSLGYVTDTDTGDILTVSGFSITCTEGSAAEKYATENGFSKEKVASNGSNAMKVQITKYDENVTPDKATVVVYNSAGSKVKQVSPSASGNVDLSGIAEGSYNAKVSCTGYATCEVPYRSGDSLGLIQLCKYGDLNGDGSVDNADLAMLQQYISGWRVPLVYKEVADVKADGEIDTEDIARFQQKLSCWNVQFGK